MVCAPLVVWHEVQGYISMVDPFIKSKSTNFTPQYHSLFSYVYKLCELHLSVGNYTEAAFTLLKRANDLQVIILFIASQS